MGLCFFLAVALFGAAMCRGAWRAKHKAREKALETLIAEIEDTVRIHEPRVSIDEIKEVASGNAFRVKLEVRCSFLDLEKPVHIIIDSIYNKVSVEGF